MEYWFCLAARWCQAELLLATLSGKKKAQQDLKTQKPRAVPLSLAR